MTKEEFDAIAGRLSAANTKAVEVHYEIRAIRSMLRDQIENPPEWQPIDYSQAESGQAPFDGKDFIGRHENGFFLLMKFSSLNSEDDRFQAEAQGPTHRMPVPEFMKGTP